MLRNGGNSALHDLLVLGHIERSSALAVDNLSSFWAGGVLYSDSILPGLGTLYGA